MSHCFPLREPDFLRIAAGYLLRTAEFLAQTHLRAKSHERTSPLSTAASQVPGDSFTGSAEFKGFVK